MAKDPSPIADALRAMREARYGHLQATVEPPAITQGVKPRKLIPYAGKASEGKRGKKPKRKPK